MFGQVRLLASAAVAACVLVGWPGTTTAAAQSACADLGGTTNTDQTSAASRRPGTRPEGNVTSSNAKKTNQAFDTTWAAGLQLTWSPNAILDARAAARAAQADAAQTEARRDATRDSIRAQVEDAYQSLRSADSRLESDS